MIAKKLLPLELDRPRNDPCLSGRNYSIRRNLPEQVVDVIDISEVAGKQRNHIEAWRITPFRHIWIMHVIDDNDTKILHGLVSANPILLIAVTSFLALRQVFVFQKSYLIYC